LNIAIRQKRDVIFSALIFFVSFFYQEKKESHLHKVTVKKKTTVIPPVLIAVTGAEKFIKKRQNQDMSIKIPASTDVAICDHVYLGRKLPDEKKLYQHRMPAYPFML
jgi:hypothetical protein